MYTQAEAARDELVCRLTPRPDGTKVVHPLPMQTPWRVVLIGDRPGALLESETLYCQDLERRFRCRNRSEPSYHRDADPLVRRHTQNPSRA